MYLTLLIAKCNINLPPKIICENRTVSIFSIFRRKDDVNRIKIFFYKHWSREPLDVDWNKTGEKKDRVNETDSASRTYLRKQTAKWSIVRFVLKGHIHDRRLIAITCDVWKLPIERVKPFFKFVNVSLGMTNMKYGWKVKTCFPFLNSSGHLQYQ